MRSMGSWPRTRRIRLHALIAALVTANVVALFSLLWLAKLAVQALSLLEVFFFAYAYYRAGTR